jgi:Zn-dependent membrane protease YugP
VAVVARSLGRRRSGARGPAVVVQLMVIAAGGFLVQTGPLWLGLVLMALGLLVGLLIVLPSSTRALGVD